MRRTGILTVDSGVSRLNGVPLAISGEPDPFRAATNFLANRNLSRDQLIWVEGNDDRIGNLTVILVADAGPA